MKRRVALVVVLALLAACSDDDDDSEASVGGTTTVFTAPPGGPTATTAPVTMPDGSPAPAPTPTSPPRSPETTVEESAPASPDVGGRPGSAAAFFLRPEPATSIVVEVIAEAGAEPRSATIAHLVSTLGSVSAKSVRSSSGGAIDGQDSWTAAELRAAADGAAVTQQGERAVLRILFLHGRYADAENVLGVAVRGDVAAIFIDEVEESSSPLVGPTAIETAVTMHEVGHLLGLVDLHLDTGREDPEHPGHSTNRGSVMYWAVESTLVTDLLAGGPPRDFDDADRADLTAIRNGG